MISVSDLSIIIPTIGESTLEACVAEVRRQAPNAEIILAGSGFDQSFQDKYSLTVYDTKTRTIKTALLNKLFTIAKNEHIVIVDADVIPSQGWAENMAACFSDGYELFCGGVDISEGNYWMKVYNISFFHLFSSETNHTAERRNFVVGCNYGLTKNVYKRNGPFDENLMRAGDDYEYTLRAKENGIQPWFLPKPIVKHLPVDKNTFHEVMRFWFDTGYPTIKVRARHPKLTHTPAFMSNPWFVLIFSPILALVPTYRVIHSRGSAMRREWIYLPFIYLTKIAWCFGFFHGYWKEKHHAE